MRVPNISLLVYLLLWPATAAALPNPGAIPEALRARIEASSARDEWVAAGQRLHARAALQRFYESRGFEPAWFSDGRRTAAAGALASAIEDSASHGLRPADYHLGPISSGLATDDEARAVGGLVDLDLLLTDAFLMQASHRIAGRVDPETIDPEWRATRRGLDAPELLRRALDSGDVRGALDGVLPRPAGYARLRGALAGYRDLETRGGWPTVPDGPTLRPGDDDPRVEQLDARLRAGGDLTESRRGTRFDDVLERAVVRFQRRHGLEADGAVGRKTLAALNVPVRERIRQIVLNLERWRWLPEDFGTRYVLVNIAGFDLVAVESGRVALEMPVIVGKNFRRTPVFSDTMSYLVFNPRWEVPPKIASADLLPQFRKDPSVVEHKRFTVLRGWGADAQVVDPATVDWSSVPASPFPFRLRQEPGPLNALGKVKFMFPNTFNVYLHDTPSRELFARADRAFSSGCIRLQRPVDLAAWVLEGQDGWDPTVVGRTVEDGRETTVRLARPVRVHLTYWTAWVDDDGTVQFREDLYGRDRRLEEALAEPPPAPGVEAS